MPSKQVKSYPDHFAWFQHPTNRVHHTLNLSSTGYRYIRKYVSMYDSTILILKDNCKNVKLPIRIFFVSIDLCKRTLSTLLYNLLPVFLPTDWFDTKNVRLTNCFAIDQTSCAAGLTGARSEWTAHNNSTMNCTSSAVNWHSLNWSLIFLCVRRRMPLVQPAPAASGPRKQFYNELDLISGELAFLGPRGLDVLKICSNCRLVPV
jgi:hypothetical protein